jgi:hypothetical protein
MDVRSVILVARQLVLIVFVLMMIAFCGRVMKELYFRVNLLVSLNFATVLMLPHLNQN